MAAAAHFTLYLVRDFFYLYLTSQKQLSESIFFISGSKMEWAKSWVTLAVQNLKRQKKGTYHRELKLSCFDSNLPCHCRCHHLKATFERPQIGI